jgi:hypothetical protein
VGFALDVKKLDKGVTILHSKEGLAMAPIYSKVKAMTLSGAVVGILAWALKYFFQVELPAEVVSAAIVIVSFIFGWLQLEKQK